MTTISLAALKLAILRRVDMVGSGFIDDDELVALINTQGAELHDLVVSSHVDRIATKATFTITTTPTFDLTTISAPPFYEFRGLDRAEGTDWHEVTRFDFIDRNRTTHGTRGPYCRRVRYRLIGDLLYLTPTTDAAGDYRLWYVPEYVDLAADGDTMTFPMHWHEYVINGVAEILLRKEESDASGPRNAKAEMKGRILAMAPQRDAAGPETMIRSRNRRRGYDDDGDCER